MIHTVRKKGEGKLEFPSDYTIIDIGTTGLGTTKREIIELSGLEVRDDRIISQ